MGQADTDHIENLVIVGSGPAGYTAAIYAARANLQPLLITGFQRGGIPGGQLMTTTHVENFPGFPDGVLGPDLMDLMKSQAVRWGTHLLEADADSIDLSSKPYRVEVEGQIIRTHALVIATGASANRLQLPSEETFWSKGISACAICDGATPQFRNEELAVVGGGDSACEEATYLTRFASKVYLVHRRDELRASKIMAERTLSNEKIEPVWNSEVIEVTDVEQDKVTGVKIRNNQTNEENTLDCAGLFIAIGHVPNTQLFKGVIDMNDAGYILPKCGQETNVTGVYVAGDCSDHVYRQAITAAGQGCAAAIDAERYLASLDQ